jgi:hypothetical protein
MSKEREHNGVNDGTLKRASPKLRLAVVLMVLFAG